ncbi:branched-chain amino acid ABC transporter permease [Thioclava sp. GXIMD2076]|uniref:Branched-chain amino acid ABC transporter permease n=1 Tax=Thioclava kandeliae TaxID=3070818 RepID=A0ABV1SDS7_9RHOB
MLSAYQSGLLADGSILLLGALSVYVILATGQLSLGNAGFMAIGAYLSSWLTVSAGFALTPAILISVVVAMGFGLLIGFPALRLRGIYLAMATLAFGEMVRSFFLNFEPTGGSGGYAGMEHVSLGYILAWTLGCLALVLALERTRLWFEVKSIKDDELAAGLMGLNTTGIKLASFAFGSGLAAVSGALFAHQNLYIEPANFGFDHSVSFVLAVILGGSSLALGSLLGAAVLILLPEVLRDFTDWRQAIFGALLIGVLLVRRQGLVDRNFFGLARLRRKS